jgi:hypothetical protein
MSDFALPSPCISAFIETSGFTKNSEGWLLPPTPEDSPPFQLWCDQLLLVATVVEPDLYASIRVWVATEDNTRYSLLAATAVSRPVDLTSDQVVSADWGNQAPFPIINTPVFGLYYQTNTTTLGGDSGGAAYISGRVFQALN